ncbi:hypothetical protein [Spirosoma foliorum]|uniref:Uncharacterized protein n=1 Tax=Spirosoma foliorum TaxID=2710596 RepID=A0A7G5H658_9BACT|nr:hypothetical protein [Spirosoma foliorum]QMW06600.1 hypothetical protein H3H32_17730 [Spirosoma foliorum]
MVAILQIEHILKAAKMKPMIIATLVEGDPAYKPGENLKLSDIEVQRILPPRTEPPRFDLLAFTPSKNAEADKLQIGQLVVLTM